MIATIGQGYLPHRSKIRGRIEVTAIANRGLDRAVPWRRRSLHRHVMSRPPGRRAVGSQLFSDRRAEKRPHAVCDCSGGGTEDELAQRGAER